MVFDSHSDIWSDVTVRSLRGESDIFRKYHYERLRRGEIEGSIFVMWIDPPYDKEPARRLKQIMEAVGKEISSCQDILRIVHNAEEMHKAQDDKIFYAFIGCEGLSGIGEDLEQIDRLYEFGVRHASLTWNEQNALATGIRGDSGRGLTGLGKRALAKLQELSMLVDVSHLNDKSFWDVMNNASGPVVATHSNSRALCSAPRNLTDEMIKALTQTGGMIGVNAYPDFISDRKKERTAAMLVEHIKHIAELVGIDKVGFGFDFCEFLEDEASASCTLTEKDLQEETEKQKAAEGQMKIEKQVTYGLQDASEVPDILRIMRGAGFTESDIRKVAYENWHRVLGNVTYIGA